MEETKIGNSLLTDDALAAALYGMRFSPLQIAHMGQLLAIMTEVVEYRQREFDRDTERAKAVRLTVVAK
jgi:hypothetical protein